MRAEKARRVLVPLAITLNVIACWIHWECVVKPLLGKVGWHAMETGFPAPFYLFRAPIWFWHDLAYLLIIVGTLILAYYAWCCGHGRK